MLGAQKLYPSRVASVCQVQSGSVELGFVSIIAFIHWRLSRTQQARVSERRYYVLRNGTLVFQERNKLLIREDRNRCAVTMDSRAIGEIRAGEMSYAQYERIHVLPGHAMECLKQVAA